MDMKIYNTLPKEAKKIREDVFMKEQGFQDEFDKIDDHSTHLVLFDDSIPIATCRFFSSESNEDFIIGRIAVIKEYRGQNIGSYLLSIAETEIEKLGGKKIVLHAQERAKRFYEKQGYCGFGEVDLEENCPHIWMYKKIGEKI